VARADAQEPSVTLCSTIGAIADTMSNDSEYAEFAFCPDTRFQWN